MSGARGPAGAAADAEGPPDVEEARLLVARGEESAALRALRAILEREPGHLPALLLKAGLLVQMREGEAALRLFRDATALCPGSSEALDGLARCLHALGRNQEALEAALAARERLQRPENFAQTAPVYLTLVWIHREERRYREALEAAEEGLSRCPDAVLAQWASVVEEELAAAQEERC